MPSHRDYFEELEHPRRTPVRVNRDYLKGWPDKPAVAAALGISEKSVERYVSRGLLKREMLAVPGRRAAPVYDPALVEACRQKQAEVETARNSEVVLAGSEHRSAAREKASLPVAASGDMTRLVGVFERIASALEGLKPDTPQLPAAPLVITIKDAEALGFHKRTIRAMLRSGELRNFGTQTHPGVSRRALEILLNPNAEKNGHADS